MKIGYFADGPWSHLALDRILERQQSSIAFVCTRFDTPDPVLREIAAHRGIPCLKHENINSDEFFDIAASHECDLFVSMSFNQIFRQRMIDAPPLKTINCHAGKLPFYRGRNVLNWALINGEPEFGVTVHYVDSGIDTGDIILQRCFEITDADDYSTLLQRAYSGCAEVLTEAIERIRSGTAERIEQKTIHPVGFYCSSRRDGDEDIRWENNSSRDIFNFVRAICRPGPQARTSCNGAEVRINRVELVPMAPCYKGVPGAILAKEGANLVVKTADSFVRVVDWSCSSKVRVGDRFK